jgi:hypothetical protein
MKPTSKRSSAAASTRSMRPSPTPSPPSAAVRRLQRRLAKSGPARPKLATAIPGHTAPPLAGDGHAFLTRLNDAARAADTS